MLPVPAAMFSLNVRTMLLLTPTAVAPSDGVDDDNVGGVISASFIVTFDISGSAGVNLKSSITNPQLLTYSDPEKSYTVNSTVTDDDHAAVVVPLRETVASSKKNVAGAPLPL